MSLPYHHSEEATVHVRASVRELFDDLDDQARLAKHMEKPSMMMMGGAMTYEFDEAKGRKVGSVIKMGGNVLGIELYVEEVVTERNPPTRKAWETRGQPRILIIGGYRMGFEIMPSGERSSLRVFIEYNYPSAWVARILALVFARMYARWCVRRMADDAAQRFV